MSRAGDLLEELLAICTPGPLDGQGALTWPNEPEPDRVDWCRMILGILYERDAVSIASDAQYDRLGRWCKDTAATAMDWRSYPPEVHADADLILAEWRRRRAALNDGLAGDCPACGGWLWDETCECAGNHEDRL